MYILQFFFLPYWLKRRKFINNFCAKSCLVVLLKQLVCWGFLLKIIISQTKYFSDIVSMLVKLFSKTKFYKTNWIVICFASILFFHFWVHVRKFCNCYLCLPTHKLDAYIRISLSSHSSVMLVHFFESVYVPRTNCVRHETEKTIVFWRLLS